tara:strand:- start:36 stop:356 length:321 start_codon:yes stop_codon:yes gene_type:complete
MKMKYIVLVIIGVALYASNPTEEDFSYFVRGEIENRLPKDDGGEIVTLFFREILAGVVMESTYRKDFFFASRYIMDTSGIRIFRPELPEKLEFWGVGGQFIPATRF